MSEEVPVTEQWWKDHIVLSEETKTDSIWRVHDKYDKLHDYLFAKQMHHLRCLQNSTEGSQEWMFHAAMLKQFEQDKDKVASITDAMFKRMEEIREMDKQWIE